MYVYSHSDRSRQFDRTRGRHGVSPIQKARKATSGPRPIFGEGIVPAQRPLPSPSEPAKSPSAVPIRRSSLRASQISAATGPATNLTTLRIPVSCRACWGGGVGGRDRGTHIVPIGRADRQFIASRHKLLIDHIPAGSIRCRVWRRLLGSTPRGGVCGQGRTQAITHTELGS